MKKIARMALGAALAVAVIGGAFAFKAKTYLGDRYCSIAKTTSFKTTLYTTTTAATGVKLFCSLTYTQPIENQEVQITVAPDL